MGEAANHLRRSFPSSPSLYFHSRIPSAYSARNRFTGSTHFLSTSFFAFLLPLFSIFFSSLYSSCSLRLASFRPARNLRFRIPTSRTNEIVENSALTVVHCVYAPCAIINEAKIPHATVYYTSPGSGDVSACIERNGRRAKLWIFAERSCILLFASKLPQPRVIITPSRSGYDRVRYDHGGVSRRRSRFSDHAA